MKQSRYSKTKIMPLSTHLPSAPIRLCTALVVLLFAGCVADKAPFNEDSSLVTLGHQAPDFRVDLIDGGTKRLSDYRGEPLLLILFSTTCPDCHSLFDHITSLIDTEQPSPTILAISRGESLTATQDFGLAYDRHFIFGIDPLRTIYNLYATAYVPRSYLIDAEGRIVAISVEYSPEKIDSLWQSAAALLQRGSED